MGHTIRYETGTPVLRITYPFLGLNYLWAILLWLSNHRKHEAFEPEMGISPQRVNLVSVKTTD